ncbi:MAG: acyl-CoA synthetase [Burkholderiaceae bacterium]|nr:acyl-CoA synthetase [Burkholderiaceae bacterium]
MTTEPLVGHRLADARIATRAGGTINAGRLVADANALAQQLPPARYLLNTCRDRYFFAVGFCAALVGGRTSLLPPARTPEMLMQLARDYPDIVIVSDDDGHIVWRRVAESTATAASFAAAGSTWPPPAIARQHVAAIAFTSGSTGAPQPYPKTWGGIVDGARAEVAALRLDAEPIEPVVLVGTVSPQHMFGLESTVLLALHGPCAFASEHPLHADEVIAVLSQTGGRRVLVTTPVHLRALAQSPDPMPALDRIVSATAPLTAALATRCETMWNTHVFEVYGCTETGMVGTRRTVDGPTWTTMRDVRIEQCDGPQGDGFYARGGHVHPGVLADHLRLISDTIFELEGRADDMVNIGGKRASLEGLNRILLAIDGVIDGAIFFPGDDSSARREQRLAAVAVAPKRTAAQLVAALRAQVDAAFLPRPLLLVEALPRNAQGKLPRTALLKLMQSARQRKPAMSQPKARNAVARVE